MAHKQKHGIADTGDHDPGTNGNLVATEGGAVVQKPFSATVTNDNIVQRDGSGDVAVPSTPGGADKATSKDYVDSVVSGHRAPVSVRDMISDADQGGAPPAIGNQGECYVVNNWGGGYNDGDIIESDGSNWATSTVIVANVAGVPPDNVRVLVISAGAGGSFAANADEIGQYDSGGASWSFTSPNDGDAIIVIGEGGFYENQEFVWDAGPGAWVTMGSAIPHNSTTGKQGGQANEYYHTTSVEHTLIQKMQPDVSLAGATPVNADVAGWANTDRGMGVGSDGSIWLMFKDGGGNVRAVELTV